MKLPGRPLPRGMPRRVSVFLSVFMILGTLAIGGATDQAGATTDCRISEPSAEFDSVVGLSPDHARVWRLYQATFLRQPDSAGLAHWVKVAQNGESLEKIASFFTDGTEFRNRYGNVSNAEFVRLVYSNVLCRVPDGNGQKYWVDRLASGSLSRHAMIVNFTELREYLRSTGTCHSIYDAESAAVSHCETEGTVPLAGATLAGNGYRAFNRTIGGGSFQGVEVDLDRVLADGRFSTGNNRCSVASINANWLVASQKDSFDPGALGLGVVGGVHVKNSSDRTDRGVFGIRVDSQPKSVAEDWPITGQPWPSPSPSDTKLNSVMHTKGSLVLEQWHASAETSIYLDQLEPQQKVGPNEWIWAAAGIPLRIDGQLDEDLSSDYARDPYTYLTYRHSFVAVDQNTGRLVFGATANLRVPDLVNWAVNNGYEDLIKFDGGASAEFNVAGQAKVAGTSRDVPVWLGIGC